MKSEKGVTLLVLAITIVILLLLAGAAINTGRDTTANVARMAFITKLQVVQAKVEYFAEMKEEVYQNLGQSADVLDSQKKTQLANAIGSSIDSNYRYFTPEDLAQIEVTGVDEAVLINFKKRQVISINGFEQNKIIYYTLEQMGEAKYVPNSV